jgi:hypothetical protein
LDKGVPPQSSSTRSMEPGMLEREPSPRLCPSAVFFCKDSACLASLSPSTPLESPKRLSWSPSRPDSEMDSPQISNRPNSRRLHSAQTQRHASQGPYPALPSSFIGFYPGSIPQASPLSSHPLPLIPTHWSLADCPPDCREPCTPGCEDSIGQCTPDCVQVAVPCLDSCGIPVKECTPETCPDSAAEYGIWAPADWHAHCNIQPQFAMSNELQFGEDLQRLVNLILLLLFICTR